MYRPWVIVLRVGILVAAPRGWVGGHSPLVRFICKHFSPAAQRAPAAGINNMRAAGADILVLSSLHCHSAVAYGQQRRRFQHNSTPQTQPGVGACRGGVLRAIHRISTPEKVGCGPRTFCKKQKPNCPNCPERIPRSLAAKRRLRVVRSPNSYNLCECNFRPGTRGG